MPGTDGSVKQMTRTLWSWRPPHTSCFARWLDGEAQTRFAAGGGRCRQTCTSTPDCRTRFIGPTLTSSSSALRAVSVRPSHCDVDDLFGARSRVFTVSRMSRTNSSSPGVLSRLTIATTTVSVFGS